MKLVVFGLAVSSSWGNGHATLWRGLCRALARRGHRVVFFERDVPYYARHRDLHELPDGELCLYPDWEGVRERAGRELAEADAGMVTSYCPDGVAASQLLLDSRSPLKLFYDLDTPVTLSQLRGGQSVDYIGPRGLADFDLVLSFTGGEALDELASRLGARRAVPLYGHVDPDVHRATSPVERYRSHLSYLGTYAADRQSVLEELFIEPARRMPLRRFLIGGTQYPVEFPWAENIFFVRHLPPAEHPAFYSSSRITLNVTRAAMAQMGYCPSGRLFEAAACGTPILSDIWQGIDSFFQPGTEVLVARTAGEAMAALELSDRELARVANAARARALAEHSSDRRAGELEDILNAALTGGPIEETPVHVGSGR